MRTLIGPMLALLGGTGLMLMGTGLLNTLLALRGVHEGFSSLQLGALTSCYFTGFLLGSSFCSSLLHRAGYIRTFAFAGALLLVSILSSALWVNPWFWAVMRVLTGLALVTLYTVIESWLNGVTEQENRGQIFGTYMMVSLCALALAQFFMVAAPVDSANLFIISALLVGLSLMPVTITRLPQPEVLEVSKVRIGLIRERAPLALIAVVFAGLAMGAFWGMLPVYSVAMGMGGYQIAGFMASAILGGAIIQIPLGRYSDSQDRRWVLLGVTIGACAGAFLLWIFGLWFSSHWVAMAFAAFLYGGFVFSIYPLAIAHLVDHVDATELISVSSGMLVLHGVGSALGPLIAGLFMNLFGEGSLPLYFSIVLACLLALIVKGLIARPKLLTEDEQSGSFVPMVRTTVSAMELHPDAEPFDEPIDPQLK